MSVGAHTRRWVALGLASSVLAHAIVLGGLSLIPGEPAPAPAVRIHFRGTPTASETSANACPRASGRGSCLAWTRPRPRITLSSCGRVRSTSDHRLRDALAWLADHQSSDGSWDADGFGRHCTDDGAPSCGGEGEAGRDVAVTSLALLAVLGKDDWTTREVVRSAERWLRSRQDSATGRIGEEEPDELLDEHALATFALAELVLAKGGMLARRDVERALHHLERRADAPASIWSVLARLAARELGLEVNSDAVRAEVERLEVAARALAEHVPAGRARVVT